jgi:hypothetical protein
MEFVRDEVASDQRYINAIHVEVQMAELELKRVAKDIDNIKEDMDNLKVKMDSTTTAEREKWLDSMQLENLTVRKKHLLDEKLMWLARWDRLSTLMLAQNSCELTVDLCDMCASECVNMATIVPRHITLDIVQDFISWPNQVLPPHAVSLLTDIAIPDHQRHWDFTKVGHLHRRSHSSDPSATVEFIGREAACEVIESLPIPTFLIDQVTTTPALRFW